MIYGRELPGYPYDLKARLTRCLVAGRRIVFGRLLRRISNHTQLDVGYLGQDANIKIKILLTSDAPCLISRFGGVEMEAALRGQDIASKKSVLTKIWLMCLGKSGPFWWDNSIRANLVWNAGFFPPTDDALNKFHVTFFDDAKEVDLIATYVCGEKMIQANYNAQLRAINPSALVPFFMDDPWTATLRGKTVLVVHPFSDTIKVQYEKRQLLFANKDFMPDFNLKTYRTVSSFAGNKVPYKSWFEALDKMCSDISKIDFDIALIGAGAYGMSIGAFIKRDLKKKAVHIGGATQLLFGIKGKRWDDRPKFADKVYNEHWLRPLESDIVLNTGTVENGCYW